MESSFQTPTKEEISIVEGNTEKKAPSSHDKYKKLMSTLPTRYNWKFGKPLFKYQGFWYHEEMIVGLMKAQDNFKPNPTDIILCTFPKSGTTWLKALAFAIITRSPGSESLLLKKGPHICVPFLEDMLNTTSNCNNPEIPVVATHASYTSLPRYVATSGCKIVYLCRDPKDALVSFWQFLRNIMNKYNLECISKEEAFKLFCEGVCVSGPFWEHVSGYWQASLEHPEKVLFMKYEDMKTATFSHVKKLAEFMGYPFTLEEEREGLVQEIINLCSFEKLSNLEVNKSGNYQMNSSMLVDNSMFFRKGEIGDWKNHFTSDMGARLDQIIELKLQGSGLTFASY